MLVVVLGAVACLLCWRNNILIRRQIDECLAADDVHSRASRTNLLLRERRQIDECLAAISASDNDIHAQC